METENEKSLVVVEKSTALDTFSDPKRVAALVLQIKAIASDQAADFDDRHTEAVEAHQRAVEQLKTMHAQAVQIEAQQQAERDRKIAEQATAREREAQEARVVAAKVAAEQAEQRAREAEESARREEAARQAEIKRQQDEAARVAAEQAARDADIEHKKRVNNQAVADLAQHAGLSDEQAKNVIIAIIRRQISSVSITY